MEAYELKLEDVMCGDWVDVRNDASPNTPHIEKITPSHLLRDEHWYGIELTPEILEKNGWVKDLYSAEGYDNEELECLSLWAGRDGKNKWWWHVGVELVTPINHVHELQHALRLCGITLEIII